MQQITPETVEDEHAISETRRRATSSQRVW